MNDGPAASSNTLGAPAPAAGSIHLPALVWLWVVAGLVMIALSLFASAFDRFPGDEAAADALQDVDLAALDAYFDVVNLFGDTLVYFILTIAVAGGLVVLRAGVESAFVALLLVPRALGGFLKDWVERPRPSDDLVDVTTNASGFSFPSGHTLGAALFFGAVFLIAPRVVPQRWLRYLIQVVCVVIIVGAGPARVHFGVHWPSDVVGGYLFAFLALAPVYYVYRLLRPAPARAEASPDAATIAPRTADTSKEG